MKKNIVLALALCALLSSCEEFTPVFTSKYPEPSRSEDVSGSQVVKPGDITVTHTPFRNFRNSTLRVILWR